MHCGLSVGTPREALVVGTKGTARLPFPFWCPTKLVVALASDGQAAVAEEGREFPLPRVPGSERFNFVNSEDFAYQIEEANRCLRAGELQSPRLTHEDNLAILRVIDEARAQIRRE